MARIKKNDQVVVLSGKDKGKRGMVIEVVPALDKVIVQGVGMVVRHVKARKQGDFSGIRKEEGYVPLSKVMPICSSCNKPCRVNAQIVENNKKVRACNRCQAIL